MSQTQPESWEIEALRGIESQRSIAARRNQSRADGPHLWSTTATVPNASNGTAVH